MPPFIDISFFVGVIDIPNLAEANAPVVVSVNYAINLHETDFLKSVLGFALYNALITGLAETVVDSKWIDLLNGKSPYTGMDTRPHEWRGIIETVVAPVAEVAANPDADPPVEYVAPVIGRYRSMIANYVYWQYYETVATQSTGFGEVVSNAENAVNISPMQKMVSAWNEMSKWILEMDYFLRTNYLVYPEYMMHDRCRSLNKFRPQNTFGI